MKNVLTSHSINKSTRHRILKCYVWSTLMYGSEAWTISQKMRSRLEAAEMWFYRRMDKIPWVDKVTNEEVLARIGVKRSLIKEIYRSQMNFFGHVMRQNGIERLVTTGKIEGKRARGRQRETFVGILSKIL